MKNGELPKITKYIFNKMKKINDNNNDDNDMKNEISSPLSLSPSPSPSPSSSSEVRMITISYVVVINSEIIDLFENTKTDHPSNHHRIREFTNSDHRYIENITELAVYSPDLMIHFLSIANLNALVCSFYSLITSHSSMMTVAMMIIMIMTMMIIMMMIMMMKLICLFFFFFEKETNNNDELSFIAIKFSFNY